MDGTIQLERLADVLYLGRPVSGQSDSQVGLYKVIDDGKSAIRCSLGKRREVNAGANPLWSAIDPPRSTEPDKREVRGSTPLRPIKQDNDLRDRAYTADLRCVRPVYVSGVFEVFIHPPSTVER